MPTVAAIFDDEVALERATNQLTDAGLGDDIAEVDEGREADTAPERTLDGTEDDAGGRRDDTVGVPPLGGLGNPLGSARGVPLASRGFNLWGGGDDLGRLGSDTDFFRESLAKGGKIIVLETDEVERAVAILQRAGAQRVHDPR